METFFCYVHTAGLMNPALRWVEALNEGDVPSSLMEAMGRWQALDVIEMIDVYDRHDRRVFRLHGAPNRVTH